IRCRAALIDAPAFQKCVKPLSLGLAETGSDLDALCAPIEGQPLTLTDAVEHKLPQIRPSYRYWFFDPGAWRLPEVPVVPLTPPIVRDSIHWVRARIIFEFV